MSSTMVRRSELEVFFDRDLSTLRVHHRPAPSPSAIARRPTTGPPAVAIGRDIYLPRPAGPPRALRDRAVLAHEVAHTLQQTTTLRWYRRDDQPASLEREAVALGQDFALGRLPPRAGSARRPVGIRMQGHDSYEHRLLGDTPTSSLVAMMADASNGAARDAALANACNLLSYLAENPTSVNPAQVNQLAGFPVRTVTLNGSGLVVTYGELNTMADYLTTPAEIDSTSSTILLPILEMIRVRGFMQLNEMMSNPEPIPHFASTITSFCPGAVTSILETASFDLLTKGLGVGGRDHYEGCLARNACHFAPYTWWRWQASYAVAVAAAQAAYHGGMTPELVRQAWLAHGYADHFLQDAFAAGHLIDKTMIMQWFVEWAAGQTFLPVYDWDAVSVMTQGNQPGLSGGKLYSSAYSGLSNDPQTTEEQLTINQRIANTGLQAPDPSALQVAYQNYLSLLDNTVSQSVTAQLHDLLNGRSVTASSGTASDFVIWGDDTLLRGGTGAGLASAAGQQSQLSIQQILENGGTDITWQQIFDQFPDQVESEGNMISLSQWHARGGELWNLCTEEIFDSWTTWFVAASGNVLPDMGIVSIDQPGASTFTPSWGPPQGVGFRTTTQPAVCLADGMYWAVFVSSQPGAQGGAQPGALCAVSLSAGSIFPWNVTELAPSVAGPPAIAVFDGVVVAAAVASDGSITTYTSSGGPVWTPQTNVAGVTDALPAGGVALCQVGATQYLLYANSSGVQLLSNPGTGWSAATAIPNGAGGVCPAVTTDGASLYLAFQHGNSIYFGILGASGWSAPKAIGGWATQGGVSLAYVAGSVQMGYWGTNKNPYLATYNGNGNWASLKASSWGSTAPVAAVASPTGQPRLLFAQFGALMTIDANPSGANLQWEGNAYTFGGFFSDTLPATANFGGSTYAFLTVDTDVNMFQGTDGAWTAAGNLPGVYGGSQLGVAVRTAENGTESLWLASVGGNGAVSVSSYDGKTWVATPLVTGGGADGGVALADYSGNLYVFYESGNALGWSVYNDASGTWTALGNVPGTDSPSSTSTVVVDGILYIGYICDDPNHNNQRIYTVAYDGQSWGPPLMEGNDIGLSVSLTGYDDKLILVFLRTDRAGLQAVWSGTGGTSWNGATRLAPAASAPGFITVEANVGNDTRSVAVQSLSTYAPSGNLSGLFGQVLSAPGS